MSKTWKERVFVDDLSNHVKPRSGFNEISSNKYDKLLDLALDQIELRMNLNKLELYKDLLEIEVDE